MSSQAFASALGEVLVLAQPLLVEAGDRHYLAVGREPARPVDEGVGFGFHAGSERGASAGHAASANSPRNAREMLRQRGAHETPARQPQRPGDEHEPAEARLLAQTLVEGEVPVTVVAEDGQAVGGQVDADLMHAPRPELELEEGAGTGLRRGRGEAAI